VLTSRLICKKWDRFLSKTPDNRDPNAYPVTMAEDWVKLAQKMAEAARAQVAADRKRLREILAERQRKQAPAQSSSQSQ